MTERINHVCPGIANLPSVSAQEASHKASLLDNTLWTESVPAAAVSSFGVWVNTTPASSRQPRPGSFSLSAFFIAAFALFLPSPSCQPVSTSEDNCPHRLLIVFGHSRISVCSTSGQTENKHSLHFRCWATCTTLLRSSVCTHVW
ncbi:unnamed protein product [Protopolystoma xenopodis]|uniref:Uncharacterized protein n=1 Tax=Protopolystoma xenopodis TaxID=117903 RepID=A0A3S5AJ64_9PLAT|nr:unnamed protein product [Protopolystoma xenopodis]